jgi:hypothetical protein
MRTPSRTTTQAFLFFIYVIFLAAPIKNLRALSFCLTL